MGYSLAYNDGQAELHQQEVVAKFVKLLGFEGTASLEFPDLVAVEAAVDRALTLAPRPRIRDR